MWATFNPDPDIPSNPNRKCDADHSNGDWPANSTTAATRDRQTLVTWADSTGAGIRRRTPDAAASRHDRSGGALPWSPLPAIGPPCPGRREQTSRGTRRVAGQTAGCVPAPARGNRRPHTRPPPNTRTGRSLHLACLAPLSLSSSPTRQKRIAGATSTRVLARIPISPRVAASSGATDPADPRRDHIRPSPTCRSVATSNAERIAE